MINYSDFHSGFRYDQAINSTMWPEFGCQEEKYPECTICGKTMKFLFQSDGTGLANFGCGTGIISICPEHAHILGFTCQC